MTPRPPFSRNRKSFTQKTSIQNGMESKISTNRPIPTSRKEIGITQTPDQEFYAHIGEWIDIPNLIDYHLFLLFTNGGDGVKKNFYLYKKDKDTPYRIAPWDCDHSFGRDGDNEKNMLERLLEVNQNILNPTLGQTFPIP